ncbi:MAG: hypothetical protein GX868_06490, partial [Actinobacteria bacterium]|nr:hypothetical protein [Actinomycetota bacterium]
MRLKLTLRRPDAPVDLVVTADATATVADVARTLSIADPRATPGSGQDLTLRVSDPLGGIGATRLIDGATTMADSSLISGSTIELATDTGRFRSPDTSRGTAIATLRVLSGPDAGREFALPSGATVVGRDRDCDVRLSDPMVSKR